MSGQEKYFGSIQSKLVALLQYYAGYNSGDNGGIWNIGKGEKEYILQPEGIDYVCLGMKGARSYYFGLCFSEASGSQSNGYLDGFSFLLLLNPASERC